ncbi:hypothetical protein [Oceanospirillum beijerinckii]|nr:hypothetical protein [Oceanospirillum beijerinckii]
MDKKQLKAFVYEAAKKIKTKSDLKMASMQTEQNYLPLSFLHGF